MKTKFNLFMPMMLVTMAAVAAFPIASHAQSAMDQLRDVQSNSSAAASASSDEQASAQARQGIDTPSGVPVDTRTPSEGSSGLSNAPTFNEGSGSGLSNAPIPPSQ